MLNRIRSFSKNEDGAVTVDWVVLCAAVVALAVAIVTAIQDGSTDLAGDIDTFMQTVDPNNP